MLLELKNINKSFYGNSVLHNVNFELGEGEIHTLAGLNGAGKSTLVNIIGGVITPDNGTIKLHGRRIEFLNPRQASDAGIFMFHQNPNYLPDLTIAQNIFLNKLPKTKLGLIDYKRLYADAQAVFEKLNYPIDVKRHMRELELSEIYMVTLAGAYLSDAEIIIMDEPMINLSRTEKEKLTDFLYYSKNRDKSVIYISHSMSEILKFSDYVTVLRDGRRIAKCEGKELTEDRLSYLVSGSAGISLYPPKDNSYMTNKKETLLELKNVNVEPRVKDISFKLQRGEILGFTGITGAGGTQLVKSIFGDEPLNSGAVYLNGKELNLKNSSDGIYHRFGFVCEDRVTEGIFPEMGVAANMTISALNKIKRGIFLDLNREREDVVDQSVELNLEFNNFNQEIKFLSGGNQQKVLVGRSLISKADVLLLDAPTKGIDIVSRSEIYIILKELASEGKGIIILSTDIEELSNLCDRVIVMKKGAVSAEISGEELDNLAAYCN